MYTTIGLWVFDQYIGEFTVTLNFDKWIAQLVDYGFTVNVKYGALGVKYVTIYTGEFRHFSHES